MLLPSNIFYKGAQWGFSDSVVRDDIYSYVEANRDSLKKLLSFNP